MTYFGRFVGKYIILSHLNTCRMDINDKRLRNGIMDGNMLGQVIILRWTEL